MDVIILINLGGSDYEKKRPGITNFEEIINVMKAVRFAMLPFLMMNNSYVVPMNFGMEVNGRMKYTFTVPMSVKHDLIKKIIR